MSLDRNNPDSNTPYTAALYRDNGAIGALLDEYEKATTELKALVSTVSDSELTHIADPLTTDKDCVSIQTVLSHVIGAGLRYAEAIRMHQGELLDFSPTPIFNNVSEYLIGIDDMFAYNIKLFQDYPNLELEEYDNSKKILTSWGQRYDVEQLLEHAIVHVLRHRRQIERFLLKNRMPN